MKSSKTLEFLAEAQKDPKLSARVLAALERGGKVTAEEILQIAKEFGYLITRGEFESDVRRDIERRFAAGEEDLKIVVENMKSRPRPPMSTCARGCLSWTVSWHPEE